MTLATEAQYMIENGPEPAETVTYCGYKQIPRNILVQIVRNPLQPGEETGKIAQSTQSRFMVLVVNDPIFGVAIPQKGKDTIELKEHLGDTVNTRYAVTAILYEDTGMYKLEVVK